MGVDVTGFERRRREHREAEAKRLKKLNEAVNEYANEPIPGEKDPGGTNTPKDVKEPEKDKSEPLTMDDINEMDIDQLRLCLEQLEIPFAHNTGEKKLREKLADVIK